ncbi:MAG: type VI secretion system amidase effector protein Tae4 [Bacteroidetes bacterium]|nr:type VI secretion system amidase effector protein Tae4 [Bacteroidota bacterium]
MIEFSVLWSNHPTVKDEAPLLNTKDYTDQCAINLSASLLRSGLDMRSYTGTWSWEKNKPKYAIRAQELANWLASSASPFSPTFKKYKGKDVFDKIDGNTGIIFFQNYWGPGHQGDHIDLFNKSRLTSLSSWFRINLHLSWEGTFSNFRNAESIWFWKIL